MKKFLCLAVATLISLASFAQGGSLGSYQAPLYRTSLDTVTNSGTKTYTMSVSRNATTVTWQLDMTKISGTTSGVITTFYVSADGGQTYKLYATDTMADASTVVQKTFAGNPYTHYKWIVTGASTQSSSYRVYALIR